ncbi:MAG: DUF4760 domain-containing protein [Sedimentitalea sp.]
MGDIELWLALGADIGAIIASLAVIITTVFVFRQLRLQAANVDNDQKRFLRESMMIVHETLQDEKFRIARHEFFRGPHQKAYQQMEDREKRQARFILSIYGLLTRMVRHGAIDEKVYRDYWGNVMRRDWERLENFISGARLDDNKGGLFVETEKLVNRWSKAID